MSGKTRKNHPCPYFFFNIYHNFCLYYQFSVSLFLIILAFTFFNPSIICFLTGYEFQCIPSILCRLLRVRIVQHNCTHAFPLFKATEQAVADPGTSEQGGAVPAWQNTWDLGIVLMPNHIYPMFLQLEQRKKIHILYIAC